MLHRSLCLSLSLFFLIFFISTVVASSSSLAWHEDVDFSNDTFPCEAQCSSRQPCVTSPFASAAELGRKFTANCEYAMYSVALGKVDRGTLHEIDAYWGNETCSIFFLGRQSKIVSMYGLDTGVLFRNWTIVLVDDSEEVLGTSVRRKVKILKFSPHVFLSSKVRYAIFIDAKLQIQQHPLSIIRTHAEQHEDVVLVSVRHPASRSLFDEFGAIARVRRINPQSTITDSFTLLQQQVQTYNHSSLMRQPHAHVSIDSGCLVHKVHDSLAINLRCAWLQQIQRFSDRDQVSFPFVVAAASLGNELVRGQQHNTFLRLNNPGVNDTESGGRVNFLDASTYCWHNVQTRLARELPRSHG